MNILNQQESLKFFKKQAMWHMYPCSLVLNHMPEKNYSMINNQKNLYDVFRRLRA